MIYFEFPSVANSFLWTIAIVVRPPLHSVVLNSSRHCVLHILIVSCPCDPKTIQTIFIWTCPPLNYSLPNAMNMKICVFSHKIKYKKRTGKLKYPTAIINRVFKLIYFHCCHRKTQKKKIIHMCTYFIININSIEQSEWEKEREREKE